MKVNGTAVIFFTLFSFNVIASVDDIKGAFGIKFGEPVPKNIKCFLTKQYTTDNCYLTPPKPFITFNSYRVSVAKIGGIYKVYEIFGYRDMGNDYLRCINEGKIIADKIENKYNIKFTSGKTKPLFPTKKAKGTTWKTPNKKGDKGVLISCYIYNPNMIEDKESHYRLYIRYDSPSIFDEAVMEAVNMTEIRNSDDSGL